jgi:hypothetical protein
MNVTPVGSRRSISSTQLLLAAGAALVMAIASVMIYPVLASFGAAGALLTMVKAVTLAGLVATVVLPVAAIVRRLIR